MVGLVGLVKLAGFSFERSVRHIMRQYEVFGLPTTLMIT